MEKSREKFAGAEIFYHDIGDYLTRQEKLDAVKNLSSVINGVFTPLVPNDKGDWLNQRGDLFDTFIPLHDVKFSPWRNFANVHSNGLKTNRDAWIYNFSRSKLKKIERGQCFPLYWYEKSSQGSLFGENLPRRDGISDSTLIYNEFITIKNIPPRCFWRLSLISWKICPKLSFDA